MTPTKFDTIYKTYWWLMYAIAKAYLKDYDIYYAQEAVSHAFIKLWESKLNLTPEQTKAWLQIVVKHKCFDIMRNKRYKNTESINEEHENEITDSHDTYLREVEAEVMQQIISAIESYTKREKLIFDLHFIQSLTAPQISEILNTNPSTVHTQLTTLRKKLRSDIKKPLP